MEKRLQIMKRVLSILPFCFFTFLPLSAQSYLEHLQQKTQGLGTVSVHQSKEIDDLVNGAVAATDSTANTEKTAEEEKKEEPKERVALTPDMPLSKITQSIE